MHRIDLANVESIVDQSCEDAGIDAIEPNTHSFIVKIWLEETVEEARSARWRGHITHVPSGERRYLKDLNDVLFFIASYLEKMKVELGFLWKVRKWLNRL